MGELLTVQEEALSRLEEAEVNLFIESVETYVQAYEGEAAPIPTEERCLAEVDQLIAHRLPDGTHDPWVLHEIRKNLTPGVKEAAMPYAVSHTYQEFMATGEKDEQGRTPGTYMWLGKTALQVAQTGYAFHRHEAARARVGIEIDEAQDTETSMRPGYAKVLLSPKMSKKDASREVAKAENLADEDSLRVSWQDVDEQQAVRGKHLHSLLVADVPLAAWVALLKDPNNVFGKSITVSDEQSALAVMEVHRELEVPLEKLPEGPVSLIEAVLPYIADDEARNKGAQHLSCFRETNQEDIDSKAKSIALRWLDFECTLADSLTAKRATPEAEQFIFQLQSEWSSKDIALIESHRLPDGGVRMSRRLAVRLEEAKRNMLWVSAAVVTGNKKVLGQMSEKHAARIRSNELDIQSRLQAGATLRQLSSLEAQNNQLVAQANVEVGGGCAGKSEGAFGGSETEDSQSNSTSGAQGREHWKLRKALCRIKSCPTRPNKVTVGPCDVCIGRCQKIFDAGGDPTGDKSQFALAG